MKKGLLIISYDVEDDKRRDKISKFLEDYGHRIQKSVFALYLDDQTSKHVVSKISGMINPSTDRIRIYRICKACKNSLEVYGISSFPEDEEFFIA